jgi:hypothetical protein
MKLRRIVQGYAVVQLARYALGRRRANQHRHTRNRTLAALAFAGGGGAAWWYFSQRQEATPAWVLKKQRRDDRREAARQDREQPAGRRGEVHLERGAETDLRVPLGDQLK